MTHGTFRSDRGRVVEGPLDKRGGGGAGGAACGSPGWSHAGLGPGQLTCLHWGLTFRGRVSTRPLDVL